MTIMVLILDERILIQPRPHNFSQVQADWMPTFDSEDALDDLSLVEGVIEGESVVS